MAIAVPICGRFNGEILLLVDEMQSLKLFGFKTSMDKNIFKCKSRLREGDFAEQQGKKNEVKFHGTDNNKIIETLTNILLRQPKILPLKDAKR
jgi:hypothetical protein